MILNSPDVRFIVVYYRFNQLRIVPNTAQTESNTHVSISLYTVQSCALYSLILGSLYKSNEE